MYRAYWRMLFWECVAIFSLVVAIIVGGFTCIATIATGHIIWLPVAAGITAVFCKLALEIRD